MKKLIRSVLCLGLMVSSIESFAINHLAYPQKAIRAIVPYPPGGGTDIMARLICTRLAENWAVPIVIDNRAGAGTVIGTHIAAQAPADGYTLLITSPSFVINPTTRAHLPYDTQKDFQPVTQFAFQPYVLTINPKVAINDVKQFIALAKSHPESLNFGSTGVGSGSHLAGELFKFMSTTRLTHIAYKGMGPALTDLIGGQIQFVFATILPVTAHVRAGRLKALAVTSSRRSAIMNDLPTIHESGLTGYSAISWSGLFVPSHTPRSVIETLNQESFKVLHQTDIQQRLAQDGAEPAGSSVREFTDFVNQEIIKWKKVIQATKFIID